MDKLILNNWYLSDLIRLVRIKGFSNKLVRLALETHNDMNGLQNTTNPAFINFIQSTLFEDENADEQTNILFETCSKSDIKIITYWDESYPELLRSIDYPPVLLYVKGELQKGALSVSVVGTRKVTQYGKLATEHFVRGFCENGIVVTSGLAYGVDSLAHINAIKNKGITYSVVASGIDAITPAEARKTASKIIESGGAVLSEYKPWDKALTAYFPQRNRIISGISKATLVIESATKGGSLITAKFAFDQGREVFAVPGSIFSERSNGTNMLINKDIARPAINVSTMLQSMGINVSEKVNEVLMKEMQSLSFDEKSIIDNLNHEPLHIDRLTELTTLDIPTILVKLLELEFKGLIRQLPGKYYIKSID